MAGSVFVATRDVVTRKIPASQLPIDIPGGVASYGSSAADVDSILIQANAAAVDQITNYIATYANAAPGARFDVDATTMPLRATLTDRTDIFFDYWRLTEPSTAAGYAIDGDGWVPMAWPG